MKTTTRYLLVAAYFVLLLVFVRAIGFNGLYGQDAHEYYRYSKALLNWLQTGQNPGDYFWPVWYPLAGALVAYVTHLPVVFSLQLVSVISLCVVVWVALRWVQPYSLPAMVAACIGVALCPLLLRSGLVVMSDALSIAGVMLAMYCFKLFTEKPLPRYVYGFAIFGALAVMTRYASVVILFPPAIVMAYGIVLNRQWLSIVAGLLLVAIICTPHVLIRHNTPLAFVNHNWVTSWSVRNFFSSNFFTPDGTLHYKLPNLVFCTAGLLHPGLGVLLAPVLLFVRRRDVTSLVNGVVVAAIVLYLLFLAGIPFQNKRYFLPVIPLLFVVLAPALQRALQFARYKVAALVLFASVSIVLFSWQFKELYQRYRLEQQLTALVQQQPQKILYTFDIDVAIASYDTTLQLHNMFMQRYHTFDTGALVLFNPDKFAIQWQGRNPMLNWQELNSNYVLTPVAIQPDGWRLYKIEKHI